MDNDYFSQTRRYLNKTQQELAVLLGVSIKTIQSFEQGWRNIPAYIERHLYFMLALKAGTKQKHRTPCWIMQNCPKERKEHCPAFEFQCGDLCWFITGTMCHGKVQANWAKKIQLCKKCRMLKSILTHF